MHYTILTQRLRKILDMKIMIVSDIRGSAHYCRELNTTTSLTERVSRHHSLTETTKYYALRAVIYSQKSQVYLP